MIWVSRPEGDGPRLACLDDADSSTTHSPRWDLMSAVQPASSYRPWRIAARAARDPIRCRCRLVACWAARPDQPAGRPASPDPRSGRSSPVCATPGCLVPCVGRRCHPRASCRPPRVPLGPAPRREHPSGPRPARPASRRDSRRAKDPTFGRLLGRAPHRDLRLAGPAWTWVVSHGIRCACGWTVWTGPRKSPRRPSMVLGCRSASAYIAVMTVRARHRSAPGTTERLNSRG